jgi:hypothetical protein
MNKWTIEEIDFLFEYYGRLSQRELCYWLGKSINSIQWKAFRLGIIASENLDEKGRISKPSLPLRKMSKIRKT